MATLVVGPPEAGALHYEVLGRGAPVALTPGGRAAKEGVRPLAQRLARRFQVLIWDRRNTGKSGIFFGGEGSEQELWADDLAELLQRLKMAPAYVAGGSAGARVSILTALRHPEAVRGLVLWSVSGGPYACQALGYNYHVPFIRAAQAGGMEAVARTPFFAERVAANPANRRRILSMDPQEFVRVMRRWNTFFYYRRDSPVIGATRRQLRSIAVPTLVFEGNDDIHPSEASDAVRRLVKGAELAESPWSRDDFLAHYTGRRPGGVMETLWPLLAERIADFVERTERDRETQRV